VGGVRAEHEMGAVGEERRIRSPAEGDHDPTHPPQFVIQQIDLSAEFAGQLPRRFSGQLSGRFSWDRGRLGHRPMLAGVAVRSNRARQPVPDPAWQDWPQ
jgi:hypothetical protein